MVVTHILEDKIQQSFLNFFNDPKLTELSNYIKKLWMQGFQFGFIDTITGDLEREHIKTVSMSQKWYNSCVFNIVDLIVNEKQAAIHLQDFEYAARMRDFELYAQEEILNISNPNLILKVIKPHLSYCVLCIDKTIYFYIKSEFRLFYFKLKEIIKNISENSLIPDYSDFIQEKTFKIDEDIFHAELIRNEYGSNWQKEQDNHYAHVVFINASNPIVTYAITHQSRENLTIPKVRFSEHLKNVDVTNINQLAVLITCFRELTAPINFNNTRYLTELDNLLIESEGKLVYCYQLENLFRITTGSNLDEAVSFRQNVNKKNINAYSQYLNLPLLGSTLGQIMNDRMLTEFVLYPAYSAAYNAYNYFKQWDNENK